MKATAVVSLVSLVSLQKGQNQSETASETALINQWFIARLSHLSHFNPKTIHIRMRAHVRTHTCARTCKAFWQRSETSETTEFRFDIPEKKLSHLGFGQVRHPREVRQKSHRNPAGGRENG